MEIHPPEHGIHSWRDFLVHMGTITLGLLIAIGLEQSVELMHHRHQLHQLQEALQQDTEKTIRDAEHVQRNERNAVQWLEKRQEQVKAAIIQNKEILDTPLPQHVYFDLPSAPAWRAAKNGGLLQIVSQQDIQAYSEVDDLIIHDDAAYANCTEATDNRRAFEKQFSTEGDFPHQNFSIASQLQLQQYLLLLENEDLAYRRWVFWVNQISGAEKSIQRGERNLDRIQAAEKPA